MGDDLGALGAMGSRCLVNILLDRSRFQEVIGGRFSRLIVGDVEIAWIGAPGFGPDRLRRMVPGSAAARMDAADMVRLGLYGVLASGRGLAMDLPMSSRRRAGATMRRFGKQRGRDEKQDCKRQKGRKCSVQPHHVLRGAERQSNSYLRESSRKV